MPGKARVATLARELGVTSQELLAKLSEMGEFVRSAASTIEAPVERRLREAFASPDQSHYVQVRSSAPRTYPKNPFGLGLPATAQGYARDIPEWRPRLPRPLAPSRSRPRREWHRGPQPSGFTKFLIEELVVIRRNEDDRVPPPQYRYWADEVTEGEAIAAEWSGCLLDGMSYSDVLAWIRAFNPESFWGDLFKSERPAQLATQLRQAGIKPSEIGWSYEDKDQGTLASRVVKGWWSVAMAVTEIERRRSLKQ